MTPAATAWLRAARGIPGLLTASLFLLPLFPSDKALAQAEGTAHSTTAHKATADPTDPAAGEEEAALAPRASGSADGVTGTIHKRNRLFGYPNGRVLLPRWITDNLEAGFQKSTAWLGIESALTYDALAMGAATDGSDWGAISGDATLSLHWRINSENSPRPMELAARVRDRETLGGGMAPSELRAATGAAWGYVHGYTDNGWEVPDFYLEQHFFRKRLMTRYGQMAMDDLLDDYSLRSAKTSFLNEAFSYSPAVGLPGSGLGVLGRWSSPRGWDLILAASNVVSTALNDGADWHLESDALFEAAQLGWRFEGFADLPARVQLLLWNADALPEYNVASGRGVSLTLEQQWPDKWNTWLRCAWAEGESSRASQLFTGGFSRSLGRDGRDRLGLALAAGKATRDGGDWQETVELFYRWQAGPVQITPDLQINRGEHFGGDHEWLFVGGLRIGFTF